MFFTMGRANECCNPLKKSEHKCVRKNLFLVTEKWDAIFKNLFGLYVLSGKCDMKETR